MFQYISDLSTPPLECSKSVFNSITGSEAVQRVCSKIAECVQQMSQTDDVEARKALSDRYHDLKLRLPAFMFQGLSRDGKRLNESCIPSGYTMLDVDDIDNPADLWSRMEPLKEECHIRLAHITPSTRGLRLVVDTLPGKSVQETQQLMAQRLGIPAEKNDECVHNLGRISFAVPAAYILYMDDVLFAEQPAEAEPAFAAVEPAAASQDLFPETLPAAPSPTLPLVWKADTSLTYQGIPYQKIAQRLLPKMGYPTGPEEGQRHTAFMKLIFYWRYLLDDDMDKVRAALPFTGLPEEELERMLKGAFRERLYVNMPRVLRETLDECKAEQQVLREVEAMQTVRPLPQRLPHILKLILRSAPKEYEQQCALAILPMLGTLGTGIRATYLDGREQTPSLMATIVGPSASGKSFIIPINYWLLKPLYEMDRQIDEIERRYDEECNELPANKQKPKRPHVKRRIVAERSSETMIKERMHEAQGEHVYCFTAEIDTVTKGRRRPTDDISTIHRMAFDNEEVRQDYKTTNSFRGSVKCMYNSLYTGTPEAVKSYYSNTENGTVQRIIFIDMPYSIGQPLAKPRRLRENERQQVEAAMQNLMTLKGEVKHKKLKSTFAKWLEKYRQIALRSQNAGLDCFYKRAAVIGFRAGMLAVALEGNTETQAALDYACWVAEYVLASLMKRYGEQVNEQIASHVPDGDDALASVQDLFAELPASFTAADALSVRLRHNMSAKGVYTMLNRWVDDGLVKHIARGEYSKC